MTRTDKKLHVYKASAGSGKTTALAIEYLKLSLGKPEAFKHILALTFTNKAAQEMKDRILRYLQEITELDDSSHLFYVDQILEDVDAYRIKKEKYNKQEALHLLKNDAKELFSLLLHHYSEYAVTTLDSFTNRLIRSFSHDLGLSFNYQVELDTDQLLKDAVEVLLSRIGKTGDLLTQVLLQYSHQKIDDERSRKINGDIEKQAKSLLNDVEEQYLKPLRQQELDVMLKIPKKIENQLTAFEQTLQLYGKQFVELCKNAGIEASMFSNGKKGIYAYFMRFAMGNFEKKYIQPNSNTKKVVESGQWTAKTAPAANKALIDTHATKILDIYEQTINHIDSGYSDYLLLVQMKKRIFPFMVLIELEKILSQIKQENELVHISDFNKIISEKISNESAPYIYERIGNKYWHYLLDEFQDTSVIQWHNLLPLVENALSENHFNLIVGDSKQAIYRWRGSEVEQFARLPELLHKANDQLLIQREKVLQRSFYEVHLNQNYRSGKAIVEFNNQLFDYILENGFLPESQKIIYKDHHQLLGTANDKNSSVDIHFLDLSSSKKKEEYIDIYCTRTLGIIQESISRGYDLKDIAVLARSNKEMIAIAEFLLDNDVQVISSESLHVDTSPEVQFLLSLLRHLQFPEELVYQAEIIRYLLENKHINNKDLSDFPEYLSLLLAKTDILEFWSEIGIAFSAKDIFAMEAYEAVEELVRVFSLDSKLPLLHFFIEAAYIFTQEKHQGISAFMEWWQINHKDYALDVPEGWNAVRLMTFHKAKGLEFPVSINWFSQKINSDKSSKNVVWINPGLENIPEIEHFPFEVGTLEGTRHHQIFQDEKELSVLDQINLFYVANTRPTDMLFVLLDQPKEKAAEHGASFDIMMSGFVQNNDFKEKSPGVFHKGEDDFRKIQIETDTEKVSSLTNVSTGLWKNYVKLAIADQDRKMPDALVWGQKVHAVLAEIHSENDVATALRKLNFLGVIDDEDVPEIEKTVLEIVHHPLLLDLYRADAQVFNEREILGENAEVKRPDRLVLFNNKVVIIDYKTGKAANKDKKQILEYMQLASLYFQLSVEAYLVYIHDELEIIELTL